MEEVSQNNKKVTQDGGSGVRHARATSVESAAQHDSTSGSNFISVQTHFLTSASVHKKKKTWNNKLCGVTISLSMGGQVGRFT